MNERYGYCLLYTSSIPRYIAGKTDPSTVHYETPLLRPMLEVTYGCMVYQEQVMQIVRDLAGYSLGRSDLMRRAMATVSYTHLDVYKRQVYPEPGQE